jgi:hypothetical protein
MPGRDGQGSGGAGGQDRRQVIQASNSGRLSKPAFIQACLCLRIRRNVAQKPLRRRLERIS